MSNGEQGSGTARRRRSRPASASNFWRDTPAPVEPITPADDVTALLRSLGPAPLSAPLADFYIANVIDRAAALATALAASADLLADPDADVDANRDSADANAGSQ